MSDTEGATVGFGMQMLVGTRHYAKVARDAEEVGFTSLHVPDHLVYPSELPATYPYSDDGVLRMNGEVFLTAAVPTYDPFGLLSFLAACTDQVELFPSVCIVPMYHPLFLARSLATVDRLSGGRVRLGAGVGWLEAEFDAAGSDFTSRGRRLDRTLEILRELWTEDEIAVDEEWCSFDPIRFNPKPLAGTIPIHIGGASKPALRRAGRVGDGWIEIGSDSLEQLAERLEVVNEARRVAGRDHLPFEVTTTSAVASDRDAVLRATEIGVTRIIALPAPDGPMNPANVRTWAERYFADVVEPVRATGVGAHHV